MATELTYPHVEHPSSESPRLVRLPRVRVVHIVMDYLAHGWSVDEMCRQHPHLAPAEVHAAMTFYFDHQEQLDEEIRNELEETGRMRETAVRSPFFARLHAKGLV